MRIVHLVGHSTVQRTPARIACYWGRYTQHQGVCACLRRAGGWKFREQLNPYGMLYAQGNKRALRELIDSADVIHCHDDCYPNYNLRKRRGVYHAHIGDIPERFFARRAFDFNSQVRHACITNGYGRHFDKRWGRLPDILDLHHPLYSPIENINKGKKLRVAFTYSNTREPGRKINAKGPIATRKRMRGIRGVDFDWVHGQPFEVSMAVKQRAHVVLDDIFSPYTHLAALEGAAVGACVLTSFDDYTVRELCDLVGAPHKSYPFVKVNRDSARARVEYFRDHVAEALERGQAARDWMLRWYSPERLLGIYLDFYHGKKS